MANKDDYLNYYREFFESFAQTVNPNDQLPVKLASYKLINLEVIGGVIDWTTQYLTQKKCPQNLIAPLIQIVIDETRKSCKKEPTACGFNPSDNAYEPLKLMQTVMAKTNEICLRYLDNSMLCSLPSPGLPYNVVSVCAARNKRRRMEDRHVVIHDLNTMFNIQEASPSSYYAIFDGHAGHDAAAYSAAHLHQFLAESNHFVASPEQALRDAFCKTDALFTDKCNVERLNSGTTAVCALLRPKEKTLYIAWVGDSQALLVNQGRVLQCVNPHKPCRSDERERIEKEGGYVCYWGTWRVNGQLAVSRAIGDAEYKPYVIAVPEIREIPLDGGEDFLILACDGLWDFLSEDDAARSVYNMVCEKPDSTDLISEHLVHLSKERGSTDNISVIIVFLREPTKIAAEAHWANRNATMDTSLDNANNPFSNSNGADNNILGQKTDGLLLNLSDNYKRNGAELSPADEFFHAAEKANGKRLASEFDDDDDLGPETDVDAVDDAVSPSIAAAKALAEGIVNNNPGESFNPFVEKHEVEKAVLEIDLDLQKQQSSEFDGQRSPREETPTPPADAVHDGGLEENLGDSDEESEDEWNYIKGDEDKENRSPSRPDCEVANILEDADSMSQLNPEAQEFVPISPTRSNPSPACRNLINDPVIAQSPKRPSEIDIRLPNPQEFEKEVKSRPSDFDAFKNGDVNEDDQKVSSPEAMETLLNGKNIDEIPEFQPASTPSKVPSSDEFHFGPNAAPFTPAKPLDQSEAASSTKALFGDESAANLDSSFEVLQLSHDKVDVLKNKENNAMSASLYEDRSGGDVDTCDLNKVQVLPENLDEFLAKAEDQHVPKEDVIVYFSEQRVPQSDTIADLSEPDQARVLDEVFINNDERIQTTDLDKVTDDEKELASPVSNEEELSSGVCELSKSSPPANVVTDQLIECDYLREEAKPKSSQVECEDRIPSYSEIQGQKFDSLESFVQTGQSAKSAIPLSPVLSPEPQAEVSIERDLVTSELVVNAVCPETSDIICQYSKTSTPVENCAAQLSEIAPQSFEEPSHIGTVEECKLSFDKPKNTDESPVEDVTSSAKDLSSPIASPVPDQLSSEPTIEQESSTVQLEREESNLIPELCPILSPKSLTDTESVVTADVNSFLDRSQISDLASPLSPGEQPLYKDGVLDLPPRRCVYPLSTKQTEEIKTENIIPEFAEPTFILTPTEQTPPEVKTENREITDTTKTVAVAVTITAAVITTAALSEKVAKTTKISTTKKPPTKAATSPTKLTAASTKTKPTAPVAKKQPIAKPSTGAVPKQALTKPAAKPRTTTATVPAIPAAKPLTNGDVKAPIKSNLTARRSLESPKVPAPSKPSAVSKASPTKPSVSRPSTAPVKPPVTKSTTSTTAPKPRPFTLASKAGTTSKSVSSPTGAAGVTTAVKLTKTTSPVKARPATAPTKPRLPLTRTVTKTTTDSEKQSKESANKLTASRTLTSTKTTSTATRTSAGSNTARKGAELKTTGTNRTTVTRTTTTTSRSGLTGKKPLELTRNGNKTTKTTKIEKPITNGVTTIVTEEITIVNNAVNENDSHLQKDKSPIDNKLIVDTNAAD